MTRKTRDSSQPPTPASKEPRGRRAQKPGAPGNSFYDSVFTNAANRDRAQAQRIKSLDNEIGILRLRLKELLFEELRDRTGTPDEDGTKARDKDRKKDNTPRILKTSELIIRAYAVKNRVSGNSPEDAAEGIATLIEDVALELGMNVVHGKTDA